MARYVVALTGASGIIYGIRLIDELLRAELEVQVVVSAPACIVLQQELGWPVTEQNVSMFLQEHWASKALTIYDNNDIAAPIASGSYLVEGMIVMPCTMASAAAIAMGSGRNLIERAADVMLKERRPLIVVPRETPLSVIHLRNLLTLAEAGAYIIPAMPAFYSKPQTIDDMVDFVVGKILDSIKIEHQLFTRYGSTD